MLPPLHGHCYYRMVWFRFTSVSVLRCAWENTGQHEPPPRLFVSQWLTGVLAALSVTTNVGANPAAFLGTSAPDNAQESSAQPLDVWAATFEGASSSLVLDAESSSAPAAYQSGTAAFEAAIPPPLYEDTPTEEDSPVDALSSAVIDEVVVYTGYQRTVAAEAVGSQIDDGGAEKSNDEAWQVVETVQNAPIQLLAQVRLTAQIGPCP